MRRYSHGEKNIKKSENVPHRFGCSQNHPKAPQWIFFWLASLVRTAIIQALYVDNFSTPNKPSCSICIYMVCHVLNLTMSFL